MLALVCWAIVDIEVHFILVRVHKFCFHVANGLLIEVVVSWGRIVQATLDVADQVHWMILVFGTNSFAILARFILIALLKNRNGCSSSSLRCHYLFARWSIKISWLNIFAKSNCLSWYFFLVNTLVNTLSWFGAPRLDIRRYLTVILLVVGLAWYMHPLILVRISLVAVLINFIVNTMSPRRILLKMWIPRPLVQYLLAHFIATCHLNRSLGLLQAGSHLLHHRGPELETWCHTAGMISQILRPTLLLDPIWWRKSVRWWYTFYWKPFEAGW